MKNRQAKEAIDLQAISDEYWDSTKPEVTVTSQSSRLISPLISNKRAENIAIGSRHISLELRFSANSPVRLFMEKHLGLLTTTA